MVLLSGVDVLIKLALVVMQDFKSQLMDCRGLEQIMECFKTTLTQISSSQMDFYLRTVTNHSIHTLQSTYNRLGPHTHT